MKIIRAFYVSQFRAVANNESSWRKAAVLFAAMLLAPWHVIAQTGTTLDSISFSQLPGNRIQVQLTLSEEVAEPLNFAIDNPARIALDFPSVSLNLARRTETIGVGMARSVTAVEASGRTRVVLNLIKLVPYKLSTSGKTVLITLESAGQVASAELGNSASANTASGQGPESKIDNIDFRRGESGEGRVIVTLSDPSVVIDTKEEGDRIVVDFINVDLPQRLSQRLDVLDFATPVNSVTTRVRGRNVRMIVAAGGNFETLAYQSDDLFTLDVKPIAEEESAERAAQKKEQFTGERLSLNFQNIEVRAVLQLIADFTGLNLVASDTVGGNLTLRLKNVPWDQALDIILKSKGLAMRQTGNVMRVAPSEEIAARERLELESQNQIEELAPLRSEFVQINYAKAAVLAGLLKAEGNSLMTDRGNVSVDERTNTLLVRDTQAAINAIRALVTKLDVPVRQVLIESRIVIADDTFNRDLGVRFGFDKIAQGKDTFAIGGSIPGEKDFQPGLSERVKQDFLVDLPIAAPTGAFELAIIAIPDFLLHLELQAAQAEGRGEVISNPRVITSNQTEAVIEQGTEIPYQEASSSGATSTAFKKAVLALRVTPQITPDDRVIMDLNVTQDTVGQEFSGIPAVNTRNITTQVLVDNGDTVVLGGVFEQTKREDSAKVPFFGDLPYLGFLFKTTSVRDDKTELLIFVTPKILKDVLSGAN